MSTVRFTKATKSQSRLRMAIDGPSGSGKTFTGLIFATTLANGGRVAVIDTERGSASKYADMFDFDTLELDTYHPQGYIDGVKAAEQAGYTVILIDSLSHAWEGVGGILELHEEATRRQKAQNSYTAWRDVTPIHQQLIDAMLQSKCHIIATMRSKMDYIQTEENGRKTIKKVGLAPVQRQGMEYEFDIVADMDIDHNMIISKTRCFSIADAVVNKPKADWFDTVKAWLSDGAAPVEPPPQKAPVVEPPPQAQKSDTRPANPETVKGWLKTKADNRSADVAANGKRGATAGALEGLFHQDSAEIRKQKRYTLLTFLFGTDTSKALTEGQCDALLSWAQDPQEDGQYLPNAFAVQEAAKIIEAHDLAKGQQALPLGGE